MRATKLECFRRLIYAIAGPVSRVSRHCSRTISLAVKRHSLRFTLGERKLQDSPPIPFIGKFPRYCEKITVTEIYIIILNRSYIIYYYMYTYFEKFSYVNINI